MDTIGDIEPIKNSTVSEQVYEKIKEYLFDGKWKQGERLPTEMELAKAFGVSRPTIRDALKGLTSLGFLESRRNGGTFVKVITPGMSLNAIVPAAYLNAKSLLEVMEFRLVIEPKTAALAARRVTEKDIAALEQTLVTMDQFKHDAERFAEEDFKFHMELARITTNSMLLEALNVVRSLLQKGMRIAIQYRGPKALHYHRLLIDAIAAHDEQLAMNRMEEHIQNVYCTIKEHLISTGQIEDSE